jgi:hypothetical protein
MPLLKTWAQGTTNPFPAASHGTSLPNSNRPGPDPSTIQLLPSLPVFASSPLPRLLCLGWLLREPEERPPARTSPSGSIFFLSLGLANFPWAGLQVASGVAGIRSMEGQVTEQRASSVLLPAGLQAQPTRGSP